MIKAIIFDLGGVLFTNGTEKFIKTVSERYGLDQERVKDVMNFLSEKELLEWYTY